MEKIFLRVSRLTGAEKGGMIAEAARVADEEDETTMREGDVRASCRCMYSRRSRVESVGLSGNSDRDYTTGGNARARVLIHCSTYIYIRCCRSFESMGNLFTLAAALGRSWRRAFALSFFLFLYGLFKSRPLDPKTTTEERRTCIYFRTPAPGIVARLF